jgi:hypothetical protein
VILGASVGGGSGGVIAARKELYREITWSRRGDSGPVLALRMKTLLSREKGTGHVFCFT